MMRLGLAQNLPKFKKSICVTNKKFSTKNELDELKKFDGMSKKLEEMNRRFETISVAKPDTPYYANNDPKKSTPMTPCMKHLTMMIKIGGPITVATFMREALTNPTFGYYMQKPEVIGPLGDFTTSPEISQVFGELLGLWCVRMWENLGSPKRLQLIEFGPGKGTLMNDMLKAFKKFHKFMGAVEINLIDISPTMRKIQANTLGVGWDDSHSRSNMEIVSDTVGQKSKLKMPRFNKNPEEKEEISQPFKVEKNSVIQDVTVIRNDGIRINWKQNLEDVDSGPCLIVAHEFFDALPVHQFQYSQGKWLERLIDLDQSAGEDYLKFSLSPAPTVLSKIFTSEKNLNRPDPEEGEIMEVSPQSLSIAQNIGDWINRNEGSALIIDYGYNYASGFSLRAIKDHQFQENVLRNPGEVDLTCNVDFKALLAAARQSRSGSIAQSLPNQNVFTHGPVTQGEFLMSLGIETRVLNLLKKIEDEEKAELLISAFDRLISDDKMGKIYKVASISSKNLTEVSGLYDASQLTPTPSPSQEEKEAENKS